jgi:acetyl-CoA carboxylase beta subunit
VSYDDHQIDAVLTKCVGCGIEYYMTQVHGPNDTCIECRHRLAAQARTATTDLQGQIIDGP